MFWTAASALLTLAQVAPPPHVANSAQAPAVRLHVGDTGIRCVRMPCPSRGVYEPDDAGNADRNALLYADVDGRAGPPPMNGDPAALRTIAEAWGEFGCVEIDGRLIPGEDDRPVLRVDEVIGQCMGL